MAPIGSMVAGSVADKAGIQTWFILGGILCIVMAVSSIFVTAILNIEGGRYNQEMPGTAGIEQA